MWQRAAAQLALQLRAPHLDRHVVNIQAEGNVPANAGDTGDMDGFDPWIGNKLNLFQVFVSQIQ